MKVLLSTFTLICVFALPSLAASNDDLKCATETCLSTMVQAKKLARWGNPRAQYVVGIAYINGDGLEKNVEKGMHNLRKASQAGLPHASYQLAYEYKTGHNVKSDQSEYKKYLEKSAARGYLKAKFELATMALNTTNNNQAIKELFELSAKEHKPSMYLLAKLYLNEESNIPLEKLEVANMLYKLSKKGYKDAKTIYRNAFAVDDSINNQVVKINLKENNTDDEVERIIVSGVKEDITSALDDFVTIEKKYSAYNGITTGSRIKGKQCGTSGQICKSISGIDLRNLESAMSGATTGGN